MVNSTIILRIVNTIQGDILRMCHASDLLSKATGYLPLLTYQQKTGASGRIRHKI